MEIISVEYTHESKYAIFGTITYDLTRGWLKKRKERFKINVFFNKSFDLIIYNSDNGKKLTSAAYDLGTVLLARLKYEYEINKNRKI